MLVLLVVAACIAAVFTVLAAQHLFPRGGPNLDEVAYDAQARALADGHLTLPAATHDPFFRPFLSGFRDDRVVFKYQPVWPALIATSRGALGSTLPLRALLAAAGVVATYAFAWQLLDRRRVAIIAAVVVAVSPFTWIQSATLLGYQLSFVLGLAAAAAIVRAARARTASAAVVAGLLLGFAAFHRPFDALLAALPVLAYAAFELRGSGRLGRQAAPGSRRRAAGRVAARGLQHDRDGRALEAAVRCQRSDRPVRVRVARVVRCPGKRPRRTSALHGRACARRDVGLALRLPPFRGRDTGPVVARGASSSSGNDATRAVWLLVGMIATLIVGYLSWWGVVNAVEFDLTRSLGPFYHYLALGPLAVLAAWGLVQVRWTAATIAGLAVLAIVWTVPATWIVLHDARDAGQARAAEVALTDAPGPRLVLEDPLFPGDPVCAHRERRGAVGAARVVGIDIPGHRLDAVERFPDRAAYLVRGFHRAGDIVGPIQREQVPLEIVDGDRVQVTAALAPPADRLATAYLRIGETTRTAPISDATWEITADELSAAGTEIAVGYRMSPDEFVECRSEARRTSGDGVRVLEPCDGYVGYAFPDGRTAVSPKTCRAASTCRSSRDERSRATTAATPMRRAGSAVVRKRVLPYVVNATVVTISTRPTRPPIARLARRSVTKPAMPTVSVTSPVPMTRYCHVRLRVSRDSRPTWSTGSHRPHSRATRAAPTTGRCDAWSAA